MLRGSAVLLTGGAVGAAAFREAAQDTAAQSDADVALDVAGDEVTIRDGSLAAVTLSVTADWSYAIPSGENPATATIAVLAAEGDAPNELTEVTAATSDAAFLESSGTESVSADLLAADVLAADSLVPSEGGDVVETVVTVGVEFRVESESGMVLAADSATDTATLAVEQSAYDPQQYGTVTGSGELTVEVQ
jgi:hypothetical protein